MNVTAGDTASADNPLATINQTDRGFTVKISITNEQAKKVKVGDTAELVNYWGDATATLETIGNDPQNPQKNRQLTFRLTGSDIQPDSNITLAIGQKSASYDAIVPTSAIRTDNNGSFVLAIVSKSTPLSTRYTATRVDVQVLASDDKSSAVSGIGSGEFVITTSTKPIEAGTQVRPGGERMSGGKFARMRERKPLPLRFLALLLLNVALVVLAVVFARQAPSRDKFAHHAVGRRGLEGTERREFRAGLRVPAGRQGAHGVADRNLPPDARAEIRRRIPGSAGERQLISGRMVNHSAGHHRLHKFRHLHGQDHRGRRGLFPVPSFAASFGQLYLEPRLYL